MSEDSRWEGPGLGSERREDIVGKDGLSVGSVSELNMGPPENPHPWMGLRALGQKHRPPPSW